MTERTFYLEMEQRQAHPSAPANVRPASDPTASGAQHKLDLGRSGYVLFGRIVDCVAYCRFYKVQLERGSTSIPCCSASLTSGEVTGAVSIDTYVPGTGVLVFWHPQATFGIILAAVPDWLFDPRSSLSDAVVQGSNAGLRSDSVHQFPFSLQAQGGIIDFSARRPGDALHGGEWGAMAETGLAVFLDPWLAYLRVDEETGLFAFYHDQLCRLTGHNLQIWSAGRHRQEEDDEGEWNGEDGWTPYPWEARGAASPTGACSRSLDASAVQQATPWYAGVEPAVDQQIPFHRAQRFTGYLGQGGRQSLNAPPADPPVQYALGDSLVIPGLYEQVVGLDGAVGLRSAKSLIVAKDPFLAAPQRLKAANDPDGDTSANYKAAGVLGDGPAPQVGDIDMPDDVADEQVLRAQSVLDLYAYLFNWKSPHPFYYHTLDWTLPDDSGLPAAAAYAQTPFVNLAGQQYLPAPTPFTLGIDARYGQVTYFPNRSFLAFLEDGGIVLVDGWGSEIKMTGGSIFISCSGDVWQLPGKNANTYAGFDVVQRANHSVYVSANQGDVRIKADVNFTVLAGNGGCGGILLESRANHPVYVGDAHDPTLSGLVVRCTNSPVVLLGQEMLLSTNTVAPAGAPNHIVLDAGLAKIVTCSSYFERNLAAAAVDLFTTPAVVNEYWGNFNQLGGDTGVNGKLLAASCVAAAGRFTANSSAVAAALADRAGDLAGYSTESIADATELAGRTELTGVAFVWPDAAQYETAGLLLPESRWQQQARLQGDSLPTWTENPAVDPSNNATYPHPGEEAWMAGGAFQLQNLNLFADTTGTCAARGSAYESAAYAAPTATNLDGNFPVIIDLD